MVTLFVVESTIKTLMYPEHYDFEKFDAVLLLLSL